MKPTTIEHGELLERKANIARRRLMDTVDELEARKHTIEREAVSIIAIAVGVLGAFWLTAIFGSRWKVRRRRRARFQRFLRAVHLR